MKKMNRFALLTLISGILASALVMGCGGGSEDTNAAAGGANGAPMAANVPAGNGAAGNAPAAP